MPTQKTVWIVEVGRVKTEFTCPTRSGARWLYKQKHGLRKLPSLCRVYRKGDDEDYVRATNHMVKQVFRSQESV